MFTIRMLRPFAVTAVAPLIAMALVLSAEAPDASAAPPTFTPLGDLPGGSALSRAFALSGDGSVVVGLGTSGNGIEAFRWTAATGAQGLGDLPGGGFQSVAEGLSADGRVVVGYGSSASGFEAFRRGSDGVMVGLGFVPGGTTVAPNSQATAASADGSVVVGYSSSPHTGTDGREAFRWTAAGGMVGLGDLASGQYHSEATAVSADGSVVVGQCRVPVGPSSIPTNTAFRWTAGTGMVALARLSDGPGDHAAMDVSADGSVAVGYGADGRGYRAVRWLAGGAVAQDLGQVNGLPSLAMATSADGSVVAGRTYDASDLFVWDEAGGMQSVTALLTGAGVLPTGWRLESVSALSADGRTLSGWGTNPAGQTEAFVATVPEPGAGLLLLPLLGWAGRRGRGRSGGRRRY